MTGHVYQLSATFELPLSDLHEYLDDPDLHPEVADIELDRRNKMLFIKAVAADESLSKYTPTAQLKAKVEEKRIYEDEEDGNGNGSRQWKRRQDDEEVESELVTYASFSGGRETVLQNTALQYPMFLLLREIALLDVDGNLTAITAEDDELQATHIVDGQERPAEVEVVERAQSNGAGDGSGGVDWRGNKYID